MNTSPGEISIFYLLAAVTVAGAALVAWSRNIVHSAFALLATFLGVAGLYVLLAADLMAVVQLLVYAGGVLVLILFAVMLTLRINEAEISNPSSGKFTGLLVLAVVCGPLIWLALRYKWPDVSSTADPTTARIGEALLGPYVLPFELVSVLLVAALVGAVTLARSPTMLRSGVGVSQVAVQPDPGDLAGTSGSESSGKGES
jgi:NAD(P)H-quinone oxidoreductase subunit 6